MRRFDLPVPPLVLGVILGPLAERFFMTTMIGADNDISVFFTRPVSAFGHHYLSSPCFSGRS